MTANSDRRPDLEQKLSRILDIAASYAREDRAQRRTLAIDYLLELGELIGELSDSEKIVAPLLDLIPFVAEAEAQLPFEERRTSSAKPSDALLVRAVTSVEILEDCSYSPEAAAQYVTRQLVRAGAALPQEGGDPRGWKRLLIWRDRLLHLRQHHPAWRLYQEFKTEIALMTHEAVVSAAIDGRIWDLRSGRDSKPNAA